MDRGQHGYEVGWGDGERSSLGGKVGVAIGAPCKSNDRCMEGEARNITKGLKVGRGGQGRTGEDECKESLGEEEEEGLDT